MKKELKWHEKLKTWLFPKRAELPEHLTYLLKAIYPTVDWSKVNFYKTLPWFMYFAPKYLIGITIPATYSFSRYNIHHKNLDMNCSSSIATIIHEGFHILQFQQIAKGFGIGFLRPGLIIYLSCWLKQGYFKHYMELPAYKMENDFISCYRKINSNEIEKLKNMLEINSELLLNQKAEMKYGCGILPLFSGFFLTFLITVTKPMVELILLMIFLVFYIPAKLLNI